MMYFGLNVFCLFGARIQAFFMVYEYISMAVPVVQVERLRVQFGRDLSSAGKKDRAQNTTTASVY
jgi:hypothetical protein